MRRPRRFLLNALTALSLLLCVAAVVVWVRSYWTTDVVAHRGERLWQVAARGGRLFVQTLGYVERAGEWETGAGPLSRPTVPAAPLARYAQTPGNYLEWVGRRERVPRRWPWATERSGGLAVDDRAGRQRGAGFAGGGSGAGRVDLGLVAGRVARRAADKREPLGDGGSGNRRRAQAQHRAVADRPDCLGAAMADRRGDGGVADGSALGVVVGATAGPARGSRPGEGLEKAAAPPAATTSAPRQTGARSAEKCPKSQTEPRTQSCVKCVFRVDFVGSVWRVGFAGREHRFAFVPLAEASPTEVYGKEYVVGIS